MRPHRSTRNVCNYQHCVTLQKSGDLNYTAAEDWNTCWKLYVGYWESKYHLRISLAHPRDCHFAHVQWLSLSIEKPRTPFCETQTRKRRINQYRINLFCKHFWSSKLWSWSFTPYWDTTAYPLMNNRWLLAGYIFLCLQDPRILKRVRYLFLHYTLPTFEHKTSKYIWIFKLLNNNS